MNKSQAFILLFLVIVFGSQIAGISWNIIKGLLGLYLSMMILKVLSPDTYSMITEKLPFLELFSLRNLNFFFPGKGKGKESFDLIDKIYSKLPLDILKSKKSDLTKENIEDIIRNTVSENCKCNYN